MRNTLLLAVIVAASALWLQAQEANPGNDSGRGDSNSGQLTTIQGCLQRAGGYYAIRDDNGISHRVGGETGELSDYVGHEVQLTGVRSTKTTDTTMEGEASTASESPVFRVQHVRDISATCDGR